MFWEKKENDSGLPDLPQLGNNDAISRIGTPTNFQDTNSNPPKMQEKNEFPSFPEHPSEIRDAIEPKEIQGSNPNASFRTREIQENNIESENTSISPPHQQVMSPPPMPSEDARNLGFDKKPRKDIFVKIDKFQSARKSLASAQEQMKEIESLLKKIRDVRMREDQELSAWEKDLSETKSRIEEVSQNLFDKIE